MNITEKAVELGKMIQESEEMKALKAAEEKQQADEETMKLIQIYNMKCVSISNDVRDGKISQEDAMAENKKEYDKIMENEYISDFIKAKNAFNDMIERVNNILTFYITGEEPGCSHGCDGCDGCH